MTDYRQSHLESGSSYDTELAESPFDSYMDSWEAKHVRDVVSSRFPGLIPRSLDFACGTGRMTSVIAPLAEEAMGVDISAGMLDVARSKVPGATFIVGDLTTEDLELGQFDLVTSFRFFGNAQQALRVAVLRALNALQPVGGALIINNHRNPNSLAHVIARIRGEGLPLDLTHARLKGLLQGGGYEIREARPIGAWQWRAAMLNKAGSDPTREARLEKRYSASSLVRIAPDSIIVAEKVRGLDSRH